MKKIDKRKSLEFRQMVSLRNKRLGVKPPSRLGVTMTQEEKKKHSEAAIKAGCGKQNKGRRASIETRKKMSLAKLGHKTSEETKRKISIKNWGGEDVGYSAKHRWIRKHLGSAIKCVVCDGRESQIYQWANISGEYKRDLSDYISLCIKCHHNYDKGRRRFSLEKFINA